MASMPVPQLIWIVQAGIEAPMPSLSAATARPGFISSAMTLTAAEQQPLFEGVGAEGLGASAAGRPHCTARSTGV